MKLTKQALKRIITEEIKRALKEGDYDEDVAHLGFDPRSAKKSLSYDDFEDSGRGNVGDAIHDMAIADSDAGFVRFVPWDVAEEMQKYTREELIAYFEDPKGASAEERSYMDYKDDGLYLKDPRKQVH
jgi:hypothetical protein